MISSSFCISQKTQQFLCKKICVNQLAYTTLSSNIQSNKHDFFFFADQLTAKIPWSRLRLSWQLCRRSQVLGLTQPVQLEWDERAASNLPHRHGPVVRGCPQPPISTGRGRRQTWGWRLWGRSLGPVCVFAIIPRKFPGSTKEILLSHCSRSN